MPGRISSYASRLRELRPGVLLRKSHVHDQKLPFGERLSLGAYLSWRMVAESDVMNRAASIAYAFVFSLIPLVATSIAFFTVFPALQSERERLLDFLSQQLLPGAVQGVRKYLEQFSARATAAGAISSISLLVITLLLFQGIEATFNSIWKVERGRTWGQRLQVLAVFFIFGSVGATLLVYFRAEAAGWAETVSRVGFSDISAVLSDVGLKFGELAVAWGLFFVATKVLPNARVEWRPALISALLVGTVWHYLKTAFTWYIQDVANYNSVYGTLGAVPVFFMWIYLSFLLLLVGACIAFVGQNLSPLILKRQAQYQGVASAFYAASVMVVLAEAFRGKEGPLSAEQVAARLDIAPYFVSEAVVALSDCGLVLAIPDGTEQRYFIGQPPEQITIQRIVTAISGDPLLIPESLTAAESSPYRKIERIFSESDQKRAQALESTTLADLLAEAGRERSPNVA